MQHSELVNLIVAAVKDMALPERLAQCGIIDENSPLFGAGGLFDSFGLVSLLMEIEQQTNEQLAMPIVIADERAMSQRRSPFRSIGSLADYIWMLLKEQEESHV